jgi:hypothetical protein
MVRRGWHSGTCGSTATDAEAAGAAGRRQWRGALRHVLSGADSGARLRTMAIGGARGVAATW